MDDASPPMTVSELIMAGHPAAEVIFLLKTMPAAERHAILCSVCAIHDEIARNCRDHGYEAAKVLASECPLFVDGSGTCLDTLV